MRTERRGRHGGSSGRPGRGRDHERASSSRRRPPIEGAPAVKGDLLYGRNAVAEALRGKRQAHRIWFASGIRQDAKIAAIQQLATGRSVPTGEVPRDVLDELTHGANHQGVALDASRYPYTDGPATGQLVIALDHLQDPQNLGTLLRSAEACSVDRVLIPADRAAEVTPAVVNASAGAVEHLLISKVTNLARELDTLKSQGWWVIGLDQGDDSLHLYQTEIPEPTVLVVGAEGKGLSPNVRRRCDLVVSLPMQGKIESLNAATAGSVVLFELSSRRARDSNQ